MHQINSSFFYLFTHGSKKTPLSGHFLSPKVAIFSAPYCTNQQLDLGILTPEQKSILATQMYEEKTILVNQTQPDSGYSLKNSGIQKLVNHPNGTFVHESIGS